MPRPRVDVHRIEFEIPWPPWTAYAYFLPTAEPILVDAGAPGEDGWNQLTAGLEAVGYEPEDIEHLLITHPHTDHDGQAATLVERADPTVYAPENVRERLARDPDDLATVVQANATEVGFPDPEDAVEQAVDSLRRNSNCLPPGAIDVDVDFDSTFTAGDVTFRPVHVPGHQIDQAAFLADGDLFAGDTLIKPFRPAALHVGFDRDCYESIDAFYVGLDRLAELDIDRVYPGHGPVFEDATGAIERAREDLDSLLEECRRLLGTLGESNPYEVTEARIDNPRELDFSLFETMGALSRLERQGVADSELVDDVRRFRLER